MDDELTTRRQIDARAADPEDPNEYDVSSASGITSEAHEIGNQNVETVDFALEYGTSSAGAVSSSSSANCDENNDTFHDQNIQNTGAVSLPDEDECLEDSKTSFKMEHVAASLNQTTEYYSEDSDVVVVSAYYVHEEEQDAYGSASP